SGVSPFATATPVAGGAAFSGSSVVGPTRADVRRMANRRRRQRTPRAVYRRRRVLLAFALFNIVELCGVALVSPGFWIGSALSGTLMLAYLVPLRNRALSERRRGRAEARYAAWIAARQAAVRREQARRAALRREAVAQQLAERDRARREAARLAAVRGRA